MKNINRETERKVKHGYKYRQYIHAAFNNAEIILGSHWSDTEVRARSLEVNSKLWFDVI